MGTVGVIVVGFLSLSLQPGLVSGKLIVLDDTLEPVDLTELVEKQQIFWEADMQDLVKNNIEKFENPREDASSTGRRPVGNKTVAIGLRGRVFHDGYDKGFFSTILNAYANHWDLETTPEDWWFTILRTISIAIDKNSNNPTVRNFFVAHSGRKELVVHVTSLPDTDFNWFFEQMTSQVAENLNNPAYVSLAQPGFSTNTPLHRLVNNIAVMSSVQEYFEYTLNIECGIPRVDMKGQLRDWELLRRQFQGMKQHLRPIRDIILPDTWWTSVETVLGKLVATYREEQGTREWWKEVIEKDYGCGGPPGFSGWFMQDLLGTYLEDAPLGIVTVPLSLKKLGVKEQAAVVAGISGFQVTESHDSNRTSVRANYAWGLMMLQNSVLRDSLV